MQVTSDRRWRLHASPAEVWAALCRTDEYRRWWPWLRGLDARGLVEGDRWNCLVKPPLPYTLRFTIELAEVAIERHVVATVSGDIAGPARLDLTGDDVGTELRLRSAMAASNRAFAVASRLAAPIVRRGHDWVLDTGASQFASRALSG